MDYNLLILKDEAILTPHFYNLLVQRCQLKHANFTWHYSLFTNRLE